MKIYILQADHFAVPGHVMQPHATRASADIEAAKLTNMMLDWVDLPQDATPENWELKSLEARDKRAEDLGLDSKDDLDGEDDGDVWIEEMDIIELPGGAT